MDEVSTPLMQSIQEAIAKNLPLQTANELKLFIEDAQKKEKELEKVSGQLAAANNQLAEARKTIKEFEELANTKEHLDARQKELEKREHDLDLQKLLYEIAAEKDKTTFAFGVCNSLVRNTDYRSTVFGNTTGKDSGQDGNNYKNVEVNHSYSKTNINTAE
jgi:predicted transcriptional regulator